MYFLGLKEFLRHYERLRGIKIYIMSVTGFCGLSPFSHNTLIFQLCIDIRDNGFFHLYQPFFFPI